MFSPISCHCSQLKRQVLCAASVSSVWYTESCRTCGLNTPADQERHLPDNCHFPSMCGARNAGNVLGILHVPPGPQAGAESMQ